MEDVISPTKYCRQCRYILDGLRDHRCPECGLRFNPNDPATYLTTPRRTLLQGILKKATRAWAIVPAVWLVTFILPFLSVLVIPIMATGVVFNLLQRRFVHIAVILIISPFALSYAQGVIDYLDGSARIRGMGLPSTESLNVDPVYRCERSTGGCVVSGNEWIFQDPYNGVVRFMISTFGPMKGSYDGPFPTKKQVFAALPQAVEVAIDDLANGLVDVQGTTVRLDTGVGSGLFRASPMLTQWQLEVDGMGDVESGAGRRAQITAATILFGTRLAACRVIHRQLRLNRALRSGH